MIRKLNIGKNIPITFLNLGIYTMLVNKKHFKKSLDNNLSLMMIYNIINIYSKNENSK